MRPALPLRAVNEATATGQSPSCFHCGMPIPAGTNLSVIIGGEARPMCCQGCAATAGTIGEGGLADFYRYRTAPSAHEGLPGDSVEVELYDDPELQHRFVTTRDAAVREATLLTEGVRCAACVWLIERHLQALPGVLGAELNYASERLRVRWDATCIRLSDILKAIAAIGYRARPYEPVAHEAALTRARQAHLRRLGVAGALGMQVMILAVALYAGAYSGIEPEFADLFRTLSLALTLPVILYSAAPFFQAAWRDLRNRRLGMDVPVALGIAAAFLASAGATVSGQGEVYYDAVVMFVFFLLSARYFELTARRRANEAGTRLTQCEPAMATRLTDSGEERVAVARLRPGDRVLVRPGERVPADGHVIEGRSCMDESLLTGEAAPRPKAPGQVLIGGTINIESPLLVRIDRVGEATRAAAIARLLERAQSEKPIIARLADRAAAGFVAVVLALAAGVALYWWHHDSAHWLPITIAVLVVSCPCALSLATPTALTAATGALMRRGLLATRGHALETLARVTHVVFDKTGTLTAGRLRLLEVHSLGTLAEDQCVRIAAALEQGSEHPIARALTETASASLPKAVGLSAVPGAGVCGYLSGVEYFLGTPAFVTARSGCTVAPATLAPLYVGGRTVVVLATRELPLAAFALGDEIRPDARALVETLRRAGKRVSLLTGDHEHAAKHVARQVGIEHCLSGLTPENKVARVQALQHEGAIVAMIGDGVNDAPVLAQAQVSIAIGSGTELAAASADMILLTPRLAELAAAFATARHTRQVIRQNLFWAFAYNAAALPAAAAGLVAPWMAALGMSASSLLVVANALRLTRHAPAARSTPE